MKRKSQNSPKKSHPTKGKAPKLGMSSPSPSTEVQVKGQALPSRAEVPRVTSPRLRSSFVAEAKDSSRGAAEPPLEVMPISVLESSCTEHWASPYDEGERRRGSLWS